MMQPHHDAVMHTTVDLPEADLMRLGLEAPTRAAGMASAVRIDAKAGLPVLHGSRAITPEDVKALEDES
jgi:hypothetical protein